MRSCLEARDCRSGPAWLPRRMAEGARGRFVCRNRRLRRATNLVRQLGRIASDACVPDGGGILEQPSRANDLTSRPSERFRRALSTPGPGGALELRSSDEEHVCNRQGPKRRSGFGPLGQDFRTVTGVVAIQLAGNTGLALEEAKTARRAAWFSPRRPVPCSRESWLPRETSGDRIRDAGGQAFEYVANLAQDGGGPARCMATSLSHAAPAWRCEHRPSSAHAAPQPQLERIPSGARAARAARELRMRACLSGARAARELRASSARAAPERRPSRASM